MGEFPLRDRLRQLLPTLAAEDMAWLRQYLLGWKTPPALQKKEHLGLQELLALESWLWQYRFQAQTFREQQARLRNLLIFMLLRYGALRLTEIFSLTPSDIDWKECLVYVRDNEAGDRVVPLAPDVCRRMRQALAGQVIPENTPFLRCDAGCLRRCLQKAGEGCKLPAGLVNASNLRRNRAQELLQQGISPPVVDIFLGRHGNTANTLMRYTPEVALMLLRTHLQADRPLKTSARNFFQGRITRLESLGIQVKVVLATAGGLVVTSVITDVSCQNLTLAEGKLVNASVKAPWIVVEPLDAFTPELENCFQAEVEHIRTDDRVVEVLARLADGSQVCALRQKADLAPLHLREGERVRVCFTASSVILSV